jgi:pantothenate kinase type III
MANLNLSQEQRDSGNPGFLGKSTEAAILLGVYQSQILTMKGAVTGHASQLPNPVSVYLTGGGIEELSAWLPASWQRVPDLVLQGARTIGRTIIDQQAAK